MGICGIDKLTHVHWLHVVYYEYTYITCSHAPGSQSDGDNHILIIIYAYTTHGNK